MPIRTPAVLALLSLSLASCAENTPTAVVERLLDAAKRGDTEAVRAMVIKGERSAITMKGIDADLKVGTATIEADRAIVPCSGADQAIAPVSLVLLKEDGEWRVSPSATLKQTLKDLPSRLMEGLKTLGEDPKVQNLFKALQQGN